MFEIELEKVLSGHTVVRKKCPDCNAEFIFRIEKNGRVHDIFGEGNNHPDHKTVQCNVCFSTFEYRVNDVKRENVRL